MYAFYLVVEICQSSNIQYQYPFLPALCIWGNELSLCVQSQSGGKPRYLLCHYGLYLIPGVSFYQILFLVTQEPPKCST